MGKIPLSQWLKSISFTLLGVAPGGIWYYNVGSTQAVVIAVLGALIGLGLSLPGVSAGRVLMGTAGTIVAYNAPRSLQGEILDATIGAGDQPPTSPDGTSAPQSNPPPPTA